MTNISNMTSTQLKKMFAAAEVELKRRENTSKACAEIKEILKKYKLKTEDIEWNQFTRKGKSAAKKKPVGNPNKPSKTTVNKKGKPDRRSSVEPKYLNSNGIEKWSGRGRAPQWVVKICERENISVENFKLNQRYKI